MKGRVHGVGFRWTAAELARQFGLKGLVRNLRNGQVELFCDGSESDIEIFVAEIRAQNVGFKGWGARVEEVIVSKEGDPGFREAWRRYEGFEIDVSWD